MPLFLQLTKQVSATLTYSEPIAISSVRCDPVSRCTSQEAAQICSGVRKLILLVVPSVQIDEDALVVDARNDLDAGAGEFGAQLVKAIGRDALFGAVDVEGGDGRVVRGLFSEV